MADIAATTPLRRLTTTQQHQLIRLLQLAQRAL